MVTVELVGDASREVSIDEETTYGDLLAPFEVSVHEVTIVVDGNHVPADVPVESTVEQVRVIPLVKGG